MKNYKKFFPIFEKDSELHYLDSGATTLKPKMMLEKMMEYYTEYSANIHRGLYPISEKATGEYENVRKKIADFIGAAGEKEIVFTSGTTDSINLAAGGWGEINLKEGDEIMVTIAEHHSNFVPWQQLAGRKKLKFTAIDVIARSEATKQSQRDRHDPTGLAMTISKKTKLLAITQVSNVLGNINDIKSIIKNAREVNPDVCVVVDGAQAVGHMTVNVTDLDADFYAFSGHKMYGPTGVGVLYAKAKRWREMEPVKFGGGMIGRVAISGSTWAEGPEKFEAGTPPIAEVIGLGAAVDFILKIGRREIEKQEKELGEYLRKRLKEINWIRMLELNSGKRLGVVSIYPDRINMGSAHDIADILGRDFQVDVRAGHHCAMPLHEKFGVPTGTARISLGIYNDKTDIDSLIRGLKEYERRFV